MTRIRFGGEAEYIQIVLPATFNRDGWGRADVEIAVRAFTGRIYPYVEKSDFERFARQLRAVYETLKGTADFTPVEGQFTLKVEAIELGHMRLTGDAWSEATYGNRLAFQLDLDQTFLKEPVEALKGLR